MKKLFIFITLLLTCLVSNLYSQEYLNHQIDFIYPPTISNQAIITSGTITQYITNISISSSTFDSWSNTFNITAGRGAMGSNGVALGGGAYGDNGVSIGTASTGTNGVSIGAFANGDNGIAIGPFANAGNGLLTDAVEIGSGTATSNGYFHFFGYPYFDTNGYMKPARITTSTGTFTGKITGPNPVDTNDLVTKAYADNLNPFTSTGEVKVAQVASSSEYSRWYKDQVSDSTYFMNKVIVPGNTLYAADFNGSQNGTLGGSSFYSGYTSITFACWVYVRSIPYSYPGLIYSDSLQVNPPPWTYGGLDLNGASGSPTPRWAFYFPVKTNNSTLNMAAVTEFNTNVFNSWVHLCGTWDNGSGTIKIYTNGLLAGTNYFAASVGCVSTQRVALNLGWDNLGGSSGRKLNGKLDEIAIWTRSLSPDEVSNIGSSSRKVLTNMNFASTGVAMSNQLLTLLHCDENTGTTLTDSSGRGNNGNLNTGTYSTGKALVGDTTEAQIFKSEDGLASGEYGIHTFGNPQGRHIVEGSSVRFNAGGAEQMRLDYGALTPTTAGALNFGSPTYPLWNIYASSIISGATIIASSRVTVPTCTNGTDAANKDYVDARSPFTSTGEVKVAQVASTLECSRWYKDQVSDSTYFMNKVLFPENTLYAADFNGSQYGTLGSSSLISGYTSITFACWVYVRSMPNDHPGLVYSDSVFANPPEVYNGLVLYGDVGSSTQRWAFYVTGNTNNAPLHMFARTGFFNTNAFNSWVHVCGTWDNGSGTMKIYTNGLLAGTNYYAASVGCVSTQRVALNLGMDNAISSRKLNGKLDEIAIWTRSLSSNEVNGIGSLSRKVMTNMNFAYTGVAMSNQLLTLLHCDENTGATLIDSSGRGNNGNLNTGTYSTGKTLAVGTTEVQVFKSEDGLVSGEYGVHTFGNPQGRHVVEGSSARFNVGGAEQMRLDYGALTPTTAGALNFGSPTYPLWNIYASSIISGATIIASSKMTVPTCTSGTDAANKNYVDARIPLATTGEVRVSQVASTLECSRWYKDQVSDSTYFLNRVLVPEGALYAADFNGSQYGQLGHNSMISGYTSITFACWTYVRSMPNDYPGLIWTDSVSANPPSVWGGLLLYGIASSTTQRWVFSLPVMTNNAALPMAAYSGFFNINAFNSWVHVCGTWDNGSGIIKIYTNGSLAGTNYYAASVGCVSTQRSLLKLGWDESNSSRRLNGKIDEIAIWTRSLSPDEVRNIGCSSPRKIQPDLNFASTDVAMSNQLLTLLHCDENTGITLTDSSGRGNNGYLNTATYGTGKTLVSGTTEVQVFKAEDGIDNTEAGVITFGNTLSRTVLEGGSTRFNINGIEKMNLSASGLAITNDVLINRLSVSNAVNQILRTVTVTNGTYTASSTNDYIRASNNVIITLPAATASGKRMYIKNFGSGTVTINNTTTNLIDGQVNQLISPKSAIIIIDGAVGMWDIL